MQSLLTVFLILIKKKKKKKTWSHRKHHPWQNHKLRQCSGKHVSPPLRVPSTTGSPGRSSGAVVLKQLLMCRFQNFLVCHVHQPSWSQTKENLPWILPSTEHLEEFVFSDVGWDIAVLGELQSCFGKSGGICHVASVSRIGVVGRECLGGSIRLGMGCPRRKNGMGLHRISRLLGS